MDIKPQRIDKFHEEYIKKFADKDFPVFSNIEGIKHGRSKERCEYLWEGMENRGLEIGSLHRWAKDDNIKEYKEIMRQDLSNLIRSSLNMTHYDVSKVVYKMFKHDFKKRGWETIKK